MRHAADLPRAAALVAEVAGTDAEVDTDARRVAAPVRDRMAALAATLRAVQEAGIEAEDLTVRRPTLDEVFLQLTKVGAAA